MNSLINQNTCHVGDGIPENTLSGWGEWIFMKIKNLFHNKKDCTQCTKIVVHRYGLY